MNKRELIELLKLEKIQFNKLNGPNVDMTRGRPSTAQLDLAMPMLEQAGTYNYQDNNLDTRNYGGLGGTQDIKNLFAEILEVNSNEVMIFDSSSLQIMYDLIQFAMQFGINNNTPWNKLDKIKFLCPVPGYDRHFAITQTFGIEMISIPMDNNGPNMDLIEELVKNDESIKGIWCVPKYSNPTGITYSKEVVERLSKLNAKAKDFRIFWDNAYMVHDLYEEKDYLENIIQLSKKYNKQDQIYELFSTSKITFAGSGISGLVTSINNINEIKSRMSIKTIGPNRINQVMHYNYLKNKENVLNIMKKHAELLRPKFELFEERMNKEFHNSKLVTWSKPKGGYFISLNVIGCADRIIELCNQKGIKLTPKGSTYPYKIDPYNTNIRIAPSVPTLEEMNYAMDVLISAIKQSLLEQRIQNIIYNIKPLDKNIKIKRLK